MSQPKMIGEGKKNGTKIANYPLDRSPVFAKVSLSSKHWKNIPISLTLHFSEVEKDIGNGFLRFGIKRGDLDFILEGSSIEFENNYLANSINEYLVKNIENNNEKNKKTKKINRNIFGFEKNLPTIKEGSDFEQSLDSKNGYTERFQETIDCVLAGGDRSNPCWTFLSKGTCMVLLGGYRSKEIALMNLDKENCTVHVLFSIRPKDLIITYKDGFAARILSVFREKILKILLLKGRKKFGNKYCVCEGKIATGKDHRGGELTCQ